VERGHKVIIITSMYRGVREGVRIMGNGMKVYHLPLLPFIKGDVALIVKYNLISVIR
jgi:phosphatidylinositol glycan class A protein